MRWGPRPTGGEGTGKEGVLRAHLKEGLPNVWLRELISMREAIWPREHERCDVGWRSRFVIVAAYEAMCAASGVADSMQCVMAMCEGEPLSQGNGRVCVNDTLSQGNGRVCVSDTLSRGNGRVCDTLSRGNGRVCDTLRLSRGNGRVCVKDTLSRGNGRVWEGSQTVWTELRRSLQRRMLGLLMCEIRRAQDYMEETVRGDRTRV